MEAAYQTLAKQVNCTGDNALDCLRTVDARTLALAGIRATYAAFLGAFAFVPVIDGEFIVERPYETLSRHTVNGVCLGGYSSAALLISAIVGNGTCDG